MGLFGRDETTERLEQLEDFVVSDWQPGPSDAALHDGEVETSRQQMARRLDNALAKRGIAGSIRAQLRRADLKLTVVEYLGLHVVMALLLGFVGFALRGAVGGGLGVIAGFFVPRIYVTTRQNRRLKAFNDQLADILNLWVNALRAGYSIPQAMEAVATEAPAPANVEFRRVVSEISIGVPLDIAFNNMLTRIGSDDLDLVFTAVNIQREVGGNLAEILDTISETIRERVRIKGEIQTLTAQGRITGWIIGLLPVALTVLLMVISPQYMGQLLFGPEQGGAYITETLPIPCGWPLIAIGLVMIAVGIAFIMRIVDIEV